MILCIFPSIPYAMRHTPNAVFHFVGKHNLALFALKKEKNF